MTPDPVQAVRDLITELPCFDDVASRHKADALQWLASTSDIYRRVKPLTPSPHLVAYFLLVDRESSRVLLCDHRLSGLWLPTGGHVEPAEHPVQTVRREAHEELGIEARFDHRHQERPFFLTVTETVGGPALRHSDVSLWFALEANETLPLTPDEREFAAVRWWSRTELAQVNATQLEPHLFRALDALSLNGS